MMDYLFIPVVFFLAVILFFSIKKVISARQEKRKIENIMKKYAAPKNNFWQRMAVMQHKHNHIDRHIDKR